MLAVTTEPLIRDTSLASLVKETGEERGVEVSELDTLEPDTVKVLLALSTWRVVLPDIMVGVEPPAPAKLSVKATPTLKRALSAKVILESVLSEEVTEESLYGM